MAQILLVVHVLAAVALIGLILLQQGKGADMGAAFGSGASGTVFGARGSGNFLTRVTGVLAAVFFVNSLTLAWLASNQVERASVLERVSAPTAVEAPLEAVLEQAEDDVSAGIPADLPAETSAEMPADVPMVPE